MTDELPVDVVRQYQKLSPLNLEIYQNKKRLLINGNLHNAMQVAFDAGSDVHLHLEEDILVGSDVFEIAEWYETVQEEDELCCTLINQTGGTDPAKFHQVVFDERTCCGSFALGMIVTRRQWFEWFIHGTANIDFDSYMQRWLFGRNLKVLFPEVSRTTHIGESGVHVVDAEWNKEQFDHIEVFKNTYKPKYEKAK